MSAPSPATHAVATDICDYTTAALDDLRALPQWMPYRIATRRNRRCTKIPCHWQTGRPADAHDPRNHTNYEQAVGAAQRCFRDGTRRMFDGIGFVLTERDSFYLVDLDHVIDTDGTIAPGALAIVQQLDTYTEISRSGRGLHCIGRGSIPAALKTDLIEMYDRQRFVVVTEQPLPGTPRSLRASQQELDDLYALHAPQRRTVPRLVQDGPAASIDVTLDWAYVAWLSAHTHRLIDPHGIPYGATRQLRTLITSNALPPQLAARGDTLSERRACVVAQLRAGGYDREEIWVIAAQLWERHGWHTKGERHRDADLLRLVTRTYPVETECVSQFSRARRIDYERSSRTSTPQRHALHPVEIPCLEMVSPSPATSDDSIRLGEQQPRRRAPMTAAQYLAVLIANRTAGCSVAVPLAARAALAAIHRRTAQRLERQLVAQGAIRIRHHRTDYGRASLIEVLRVDLPAALPDSITHSDDVHTSTDPLAPNQCHVHTLAADSILLTSVTPASAPCIRDHTCDPCHDSIAAPVAPNAPHVSSPSAGVQVPAPRALVYYARALARELGGRALRLNYAAMHEPRLCRVIAILEQRVTAASDADVPSTASEPAAATIALPDGGLVSDGGAGAAWVPTAQAARIYAQLTGRGSIPPIAINADDADLARFTQRPNHRMRRAVTRGAAQDDYAALTFMRTGSLIGEQRRLQHTIAKHRTASWIRTIHRRLAAVNQILDQRARSQPVQASVAPRPAATPRPPPAVQLQLLEGPPCQTDFHPRGYH